ncbi:MAG: type I-C CRISPR-associated endonuclease Cas1 [Ruminococcus sp.]|uniref:type I-C CRISPR-associated endonuclease Cas1c n=2 Tax=Ruminococcus sp. TaxID=41978 RepID=UPI0025E4C6F4|nr:type I-C CRISPR-associated endonuclease Cas1c [Ruminococcus sp.]MBR0528952.1 type I-C CRISPR-associated endonuclease Cas1 [Ruminococcus sp.]
MKKLLNTLYITSPDRYLSMDGENVVIQENGKELGRVPLHNLERIMTFGYTGASPALMGKCAANGIELIFMSGIGKFLARVEGEVNGNVLLRRQQYRYADDKKVSLDISKNIICAKLFNSRWTIERTLRDHPMRIDTEKFRACSEQLKTSINNAQNASDMDSLRGIEGEGAQIYFSVFDDMILQQNNDFTFSTRNKRPPRDNVNALLSFAYSLATSMCTSSLEAVGLDPYVGFMHTDRPGRRSLALDLVEEFRAPLCDRFVLTLINKKIITANDMVRQEDGAVILTDNGRRTFISAWQKRKDDELKHPFLDEKMEWGIVPYAQSLLLARFIRGDIDAYPPFMWK